MVLVSLLGDFDSSILPVFFEYKSDITVHVLVYCGGEREDKKAFRIARGLNALRAKYRLKCTLREIRLEKSDLESILKLSISLAQFAPPDHLFLNVSDGEADIAILLAKEILDIDAKLLIYGRYSNDLSVLTANGLKKAPLKHNMNIDDHIISKGYQLIEAKSKSDLERRKPFAQEITNNFALFQKYRKRIMEGKEINEELYGAIIRPLYKIGAVNRRGKPENINYILGELFEEQIYHIVSRLDFDDVISGAKVRYETINGVTIQNEFDVLMIKNNHLYIIECKFRDRVDGENLIYKYDALLEQMDADGKVMIINVASTENKEALKRGKRIHRNFEKGALSRAQLNNILIYYEPTLDTLKLTAMMRRFFNA
ncbi:MAG: DUF1887 family protein [Helicobacteraceae bacterium]|jgi:hypothetical protein|nr:DUF1887 family protein [Helicobacteraceae bacterium]